MRFEMSLVVYERGIGGEEGEYISGVNVPLIFFLLPHLLNFIVARLDGLHIRNA